MPTPSTDILGSEPIRIPPELGIRTPEQREVYTAAVEFERFFVNHLIKAMDQATKTLSEGSDAGGDSFGAAGQSGYQDMIQDQMSQAVLDGGGLGLAGMLYRQVAESGAFGGGRSSTGGAKR